MTREQKLDLAEKKAKQMKRKLKPLADGKMCPICGSDSSHLCYVSKDDDVWAECLRCGSRVLINENDRVLGEQLISKRAVLDAIKFEDKWLSDANGHNSNTKIAFNGIYTSIEILPTYVDADVVIEKSGFLKYIAENMNPNEYQMYYNQYYHTTDEKVGGQDG